MTRWMMVLIGCMTLGGCEVLLDEECDAYVEYVCSCDQSVDCDTLSAQLAGGSADVQETCRLDLACYESADSTADATCSEFEEDALGECEA
ncbi:MAG: hypothetical protein ACI9MC_000045 [Kiritimatiellia bacterium]|jgi:hypothetical protein